MKWIFALASCIFALPSFAFAQVVINEVMYNPQGTDTGREWVELYNEGQSDVSMVGGSGKGSWRINDGANHTLTDPASGTGRGSLTIPAGGYLVIASDPNDFISGEYAGGAYSVVKSSISLNNNGSTVTLLDGTGATVDTFTYLPSQGGNDDGSSLQRQIDGTWIAALPTPGFANSNVAYVAPVAAQTPAPSSDQADASGQLAASSTSQAPPQTTTSSYVAPPVPSLYADAGGDKTVIVGADVEFDASAYDKTQTLLDPSTVRFIWNFGDGSAAEGDAVLHHFSYPGRYAVVLEIADNKNAAADQVTVIAQPAALSFELLPGGGVEIQNLAGHDLDLSGWVVREDAGAFAHQFVLPEQSKVLSGSSMQVSAQTLQFRASSSTMLEYPNGALALAMGEGSTGAASIQLAPSAQPAIAAPVAALPASHTIPAPQQRVAPIPSGSAQDQDDATGTDPDAGADMVDAATGTASTVLQMAPAASAPLSKYLWWSGVIALAAAAGFAIVAAGYFKKGEWDIVEEKEE